MEGESLRYANEERVARPKRLAMGVGIVANDSS